MKYHRYSAADVERCLQRKSWWAMLFVLPVARRLSLLLINRTSVTPNTITIGSFAFVVAAAWFFAQGSHTYLLFGALLFEINYLFDCVDGTIARVKKLGTPLGAYLDPKFDRLRMVLISFALAYGQWRVGEGMATVLALLVYLGVNNLIILTRSAQERVLISHGFSSKLGADLVNSTSNQGFLSRWLFAATQRNMMPYYHDVELDALVFVLGPVLGLVLPFTIVAISLGILLVLCLDVLFIMSLLKSAKGKL